MTILFYVFLVGALLMVASSTGILENIGSFLTGIKWGLVLRIILGVILGVALCYSLCIFGIIAGVIGLAGGFVLGMFVPSLIALAWGAVKFTGKIVLVVGLVLIVVMIVTGLI